MAELNLDEIAARARAAAERADKATAGPWSWSQYPSGSTCVNFGPRDLGDDGVFLYLTRRDGSEPRKADDAAFIAAARTDVPALAADVTALVAEVARLRDDLEHQKQLYQAATVGEMLWKQAHEAEMARLRAVLRDCPHDKQASTFSLSFEKWYWDEVAPLLGEPRQ